MKIAAVLRWVDIVKMNEDKWIGDLRKWNGPIDSREPEVFYKKALAAADKRLGEMNHQCTMDMTQVKESCIDGVVDVWEAQGCTVFMLLINIENVSHLFFYTSAETVNLAVDFDESIKSAAYLEAKDTYDLWKVTNIVDNALAKAAAESKA